MHDDICHACSIVGYLLRRCNGLAPTPTTQIGGMFRRDTLMKLTAFDLPMNYAIVHRRENENDIGLFRAYGPAGWEKDFVTPIMAGYGCWEHHDQVTPGIIRPTSIVINGKETISGTFNRPGEGATG